MILSSLHVCNCRYFNETNSNKPFAESHYQQASAEMMRQICLDLKAIVQQLDPIYLFPTLYKTDENLNVRDLYFAIYYD